MAIYFKQNEVFISPEKGVVSNESEERRLRVFVRLVFFPVFVTSIDCFYENITFISNTARNIRRRDTSGAFP